MSALDIIRGRQVVAPLTNKSGGSLAEGIIAIFDTTADDAFTTTTTAKDKKVIGVLAETIADDAEGRVIINGYVPVLTVDAATSRGNYLYSSTSAGKATPSASLVPGVFGIALSAVGAAGNISALIWPMPPLAQVTNLVLLGQEGISRTDSGCAAAAKVEIGNTNKVDIMVLAFDKDADEYAQWSVVMPLDYDGGTVTAIIYWTCAAAVGDTDETVSWDIGGRSYGDDEALDQASGSMITVNDTWIADEDLHVSATTAAITLAGTPAAGELVQFQVMRDVSDDTLGGDALLMAVYITYTRSYAVTG